MRFMMNTIDYLNISNELKRKKSMSLTHSISINKKSDENQDSLSFKPKKNMQDFMDVIYPKITQTSSLIRVENRDDSHLLVHDREKWIYVYTKNNTEPIAFCYSSLKKEYYNVYNTRREAMIKWNEYINKSVNIDELYVMSTTTKSFLLKS